MIRQFYITIQACEKFTFMEEPEVIELLLKDSDVKDHLADKLHTYNNWNDNKILALMNFYVSLDTEHQIMFDTSMNALIDAVNCKIIQY